MYFDSDYGSDHDNDDHGSEHSSEHANPYADEQELHADVEALRAAAKAAGGPCVFHEVKGYKAPISFTCTSGVLLWGQLHSLMEGFVAMELDHPLASQYKKAGFHEPKKRRLNNNHDVVEHDNNGLHHHHHHSFHFRVSARKGLWKVEALDARGSIKGYLCHHVDVDGKDILRRTTHVGESCANDHDDREVAYVHDSDWGRVSCLKGRKLLPEVLKPEPKPPAPPKEAAKASRKKKYEDNEEQNSEDEEEYEEDIEYEESEEEDEEEEEDRLLMDIDSDGCPLVWSEDDDKVKHRKEVLKEKMKRSEMEEKLLKGKCPGQVVVDRFMLVDVQAFPRLVQALTEDPARLQESRSLRFTNGCNGGSSDSAFGVNLCVTKAEREFGWLVFQNGELVGFRYDTVRDDRYFHRHILEYVDEF